MQVTVNEILRLEKNMALTNDNSLTSQFDQAMEPKIALEDKLIDDATEQASADTKPLWLAVQKSWDDYKLSIGRSGIWRLPTRMPKRGNCRSPNRARSRRPCPATSTA